jgi:hypothetical protein
VTLVFRCPRRQGRLATRMVRFDDDESRNP